MEFCMIDLKKGMEINSSSILCYMYITHRGYSGKKLTDNVQCEIFQTIAEEAKQNYNHNIIFELTSNTPEQIEANVDAICMWMEQWKTPR